VQVHTAPKTVGANGSTLAIEPLGSIPSVPNNLPKSRTRHIEVKNCQPELGLECDALSITGTILGHMSLVRQTTTAVGKLHSFGDNATL